MIIDQRKNFWHRASTEEVRDYFDCTCTLCEKFLPYKSQGVIHHKTYKHKGGIYNASAEELLIVRKITYLCHDCHRYTHENLSIDGITHILPIQSERASNEQESCSECGEWIINQDGGKCEPCRNSYLRDISEYIY